MNTAPDSVDQNGLTDAVAAFFTFGPGFTTGIYVLTALGIALFAIAMIAWTHTENTRLLNEAARLRTANGGDSTTTTEA